MAKPPKVEKPDKEAKEWRRAVLARLDKLICIEEERMAREQELNDKLDALTTEIGKIGTYIAGIADDLRNGSPNQALVDSAIAKLDGLSAQVTQIQTDAAPDPTP